MREPLRARWRRIVRAVLCTVVLTVPPPAFAAATDGGGRAVSDLPRALTFPVHETFDRSSNSGSTVGSAAVTGDGWMRLTSAASGQAGTWKMNDSFPSSLGVIVEFTYATYGGTAFDGKRGDGLSFYLTDGTAANGVGAPGGGLGYACAKRYFTCSSPYGVPGAYLGIGFDEYGNFSSADVGNGGPGNQPNKIVVRGGGNRSSGYRYATAVGGPDGTVETGSRAEFRTVRIALLPSGGRMKLSLWSDAGPGTAMTKLISDYDVSTIGSQPSLPSTLKVGFAGSTGGATNIHEVGDLKINVPVDLAVTKAVSPSTVPAAGGPVTYTITVSNDHTNDVSGAIVRDDVPGLTEVTWTCRAGDGGSCGQASGSGNTLHTTADLKKGGSVTYTITGTAPAQPTTLRNTATVQPPADRTDIHPDDNTATSPDTTVTARADVAAEKEGLGTGPVTPGEEFDYRITAVNHGPSDTTSVDTVDTLPDPLTFVASPDGCTAAAHQITCPARAALAAGGQTSWTFRVRLDPAYTGDGTDLLNTATVRHAVADPVPENNDSAAAAPPGGVRAPRADLATVKSTKAARPVAPGETYGYTVTVTNRGPSVAHQITLSDPLVPALDFVSSADGCAEEDRTVGCGPVGELAPGQSVTWHFTVRLDPAYSGDGSDIRNTATAQADTEDPDPRNNMGTAGPPGGSVRPARADVELDKRATAG
ncbi:hypothetical protein [Streptomyces sp. MUM 16J]|uniref:DUF7507 domain-containing protein n=1 Tax=Streptomyces sp. MUM 16J TaxID=2791988 RepID=UPI001F04CBF2|nr:hypothetical protein [Streptomyces sp. MUM 16J]MCH0558142.1 DUF11 domain-containing protein [Streptomyces sp. MUM 16J]